MNDYVPVLAPLIINHILIFIREDKVMQLEKILIFIWTIRKKHRAT